MLLASTFVMAVNYDKVIISYLEKGFLKDKDVKNLDIKVISKSPLLDKKSWSAYILSISGENIRDNKSHKFSYRSLYFTDGSLVTPDLRNAITDERYKETMSPKFEKDYYDDSFHIFGNKNAKHKIAIFSDPLCPYCIKYVPQVLKILKQKPNEYSVYYYHLPLLRMHPASETLIKASIVLENSQKNYDVTKIYNIKISAREKDNQKILDTFNKVMNSNISLKDLKDTKVVKHYEKSLDISKILMVNGTPSLFYDDKKDSIGRFLD